MLQERIDNYNNHAKLLADIALAILNDDKSALDISGIKEIIALYLLIPYMTKVTLKTPDEKCVIPKITGLFYQDISFEDLRNTICHSFVTVEEDRCDGTNHGKKLIFDDRIYEGRKEHYDKGRHGSCFNVPTEYVHARLLDAINEILAT